MVRLRGIVPGGGVSLLLVLAGCFSPPAASEAKDHFLTIGGGYSPQGNQVSLEKNVFFFQRLLAEQGLADAPHSVYFSDGDDPARDLQYSEPLEQMPPANVMLARLMDQERGISHRYRSHEIADVAGPSDMASIQRWFSEEGAQLDVGDRLFIYMTGHGGKGDPTENPHFYLWNREKIPMRDFVKELDKVSAEVPVVIVMVQCYSGGFANVIFNDGQPTSGVSSALRCGFYATVEDRPAAGCTPDIQEENYHEYSSYFWAALGGRTRLGEPIEPPDYDGDGQISLSEAHAYALIHSTTIDISVKTSDAFLRSCSRTGTEAEAELVRDAASYDEIVALADPVDLAVIEQLSSQLGFASGDRTAEATRRLEKLEQQRRQVQSLRRPVDREYQSLRREILATLKQRWPELENRWHPLIDDLLTNRPDVLIEAIQAHPRYNRYVHLHERLQASSQQELDLERQWVKCRRLLRTLENVVLAANLPQVADAETWERWQQLRDCELMTLGTPRRLSREITSTEAP